MADKISKYSIEGTTSVAGLKSKLDVTVSSNFSGGSECKLTLSYYNGTDMEIQGTGKFSVTLDGKSIMTGQKNVTLKKGEWVVVLNGGSLYGAGGKNQVEVKAIGGISYTDFTKTYLETKIDIPKVPKTVYISAFSSSDGTLSGDLTVKWLSNDETLHNRLFLYCKPSTGEEVLAKRIEIGQAESPGNITIKLSEDEVISIYEKFPDSDSCEIVAKIGGYTYETDSNDKYIGQAEGFSLSSKDALLRIPEDENTKPTINKVEVKGINSGLTGYTELVQKKSSLHIELNCSAKADARFKKIKIVVGEKVWNTDITNSTSTIIQEFSMPGSSYLVNAGDVPLEITVTDSRGFTAVYSTTIFVNAFKKPQINSLVSQSGMFDEEVECNCVISNSKYYSRIVASVAGTEVQVFDIDNDGTHTLLLNADGIENAYRALPNKPSGDLVLTLKTFVDPELTQEFTDERVTKTIALNIPVNDETMPYAKISTKVISELNEPFNSLFLSGKNRAEIDLIERQAQFGAEISSYSVTIRGTKVTPPYITGLLDNNDYIIEAKITDTRGISRLLTKTIRTIAYAEPRLMASAQNADIVIARCEIDGKLSDGGDFLLINAARSYSKVIDESGVQRNRCSLELRSAAEGASLTDNWVTLLSGDNTTTDEFCAPVRDSENTLIAFSSGTAYTVQIRVRDTLGGEHIHTVIVPTEKVFMHRSGSRNAISFGKMITKDNSIDVGEGLTVIVREALVLKSRDGTFFEITVDSEGALNATLLEGFVPEKEEDYIVEENENGITVKIANYSTEANANGITVIIG